MDNKIIKAKKYKLLITNIIKIYIFIIKKL